ncbi:MAG TPA: hypothetical protein VL119_07285 [Acidimicrobiia bacterium]|nr:hypothetical protein [Acidimicrobiia bacterium]
MVSGLSVAACGSGAGAPTKSAIDLDRATAQATISSLLGRFDLGIQRWSIDAWPNAPKVYELSIYTRPAKAEPDTAYAARFAPLAAAVIPAVLARYPEITWVDLCQEKAKTPSGVWEPTPVTRLEVSRSGSSHIDWAHVDTAALLRRNRVDATNVQIETHFDVAHIPLWQAAAARARSTGG